MAALDLYNCEAYFKGEVRPIVFEIYSESGIPFELPEEFMASGHPKLPKSLAASTAVCVVKDEEGIRLHDLPCILIGAEPAKKTMLTSWDTSSYELGFYRLQVWCAVNISGAYDTSGKPIIEAKLASEDLLRNIKEN